MKLAPIGAQKSECAIGTCDKWTIGPRFRLVRTFDLRPFIRTRRSWWTIPGLSNPGLSSLAPLGRKTKASAQGLWPTALSEQSYPKPYLRAIPSCPGRTTPIAHNPPKNTSSRELQREYNSNYLPVTLLITYA